MELEAGTICIGNIVQTSKPDKFEYYRNRKIGNCVSGDTYEDLYNHHVGSEFKFFKQ
ncbi:hypothetical protein Hanom_Chr11g00996031 [Helianthus anomalus]